TGLVDDTSLHAQIDDFALARNAGAVHDVEFGLLEWRRDFVFNYLDAGFVTHHFVALFNGADATNVEPDRRIELERITACGGFGVTEHDANFHANLVNEDNHAIGTLDVGGQLAQSLAHEAGLQAG